MLERPGECHRGRRLRAATACGDRDRSGRRSSRRRSAVRRRRCHRDAGPAVTRPAPPGDLRHERGQRYRRPMRTAHQHRRAWRCSPWQSDTSHPMIGGISSEILARVLTVIRGGDLVAPLEQMQSQPPGAGADVQYRTARPLRRDLQPATNRRPCRRRRFGGKLTRLELRDQRLHRLLIQLSVHSHARRLSYRRYYRLAIMRQALATLACGQPAMSTSRRARSERKHT